MFGLMRPQTCAGRQARRLYYCGTCKTLGRSYGQRTRMLLNHDMVFLAEVLGALGGAPSTWAPAYRSFNCLARPVETPAILEYAADATLILAKWKIADHIDDTAQRGWLLARRLFKTPAGRASKRLRAGGFPLEEVERMLAGQSVREAGPMSLDDVAEPTARATSAFFSHGATIARRNDLADALGMLGRSFGYLIYLLDAYEDFDRDLVKNAFNALRSLGLSREWAAAEIRRIEADIIGRLALLPVPRAFLTESETRLRANLAGRLGERLPVLCDWRKPDWKGRWKEAVAFGRQIREQEGARWIKGAAIVASVSVIAFGTPHWAKSAHSWRECLSLSLNLMAAGSVFAMANLPAKKPSNVKSCWCVPDCCDCDCCCDGCCDSVCDC